MGGGLDENNDPQNGQSIERWRRKRRFGVQVPLYQKDSTRTSTRLSADEYHAAVQRQREFRESLRRKRITPRNIALGVAILLFDVAILQLPPYIIKVLGMYNQILLGQWIVGLVGVITVATFIYIFTSGR